MKKLIPTLRVTAVFCAFLALPQLASAANRTFSAVTPTPTSTNVVQGVASTSVANVAIQNGSGASTRFVGNAQVTTFVSPPNATISASVAGASYVYPNANTTLNFTLTVNTTASTPSGTFIIGIVADTNSPYVGDNITPVTNTYTLNVGSVFQAQKVWTPAGANTNWSTAGNWTLSGAPVSSNDVDFYDTGATNAAGVVNNVVDSSQTIGSLTYGQTNNSNFHTTLIPSGVTLTVGGDANGLVTGTGTDPGDGITPTAAITGAGTLVVSNPNANVNVSQSHVTAGNAVAQTHAMLDLSGLASFSATVSRVLVGTDISIKGAGGALNLAKTNNITVTVGSTAPQIDVGDNTQASGSPAIQSVLVLGQTNAIYADSVAVGRGKTDNNGGLMVFSNNFASSSAYFRGTNGTASRVGTWFIGDGYGSKSYYAYGTCDFSLGTVNLLVDTMYVGRGASTTFGSGANDPGTGTLMFGAGNLDINTLEIGYSTANASGTGIVNANGGSLVVNTFLEIAHTSGSSGTLNISNGVVKATPGITAGGGTATLSMAGGTLTVTNGSATIATMASPLAAFTVSNSVLNLSVQSLVPSAATASLTANGTANTINFSSIPLLTGFPSQFPIIEYSSSGGNLATFVLGTLPAASPAYGGYISNNVANNSIDFVITNGPFTPALTWDGTPNGNWNTGTANWRPKSGPDTTFANGNFVTFDDTLTGTTNVNITVAVSPATLSVFDTNASYNFSGGGSLSGSMTLVKNGSAALTLAETGGDNFSGGILVNNGTLILDNANGNISGNTTINAGTVQVGNNDTKGALPSGSVSVTGTLAFDNANNVNVTNAISGAGAIQQNSANSTTLSGNSTFTGAATISQGTLSVGASNGLGVASSVLIDSGATFDVGGVALFGNGNAGLAVTVAGAGVGGNGAIVNNSTNSNTRVLHNVTMTADTTFGGNSDWDIRNSSGNSATSDASLTGAYNITKVGTNTFTLRGVTIDGGLGNMNVQGGELHFTATATAPISTLGDSTKTATVYSNATLTFDTIGTVPGKNISLNNGGTLKSSSTNTLSSPITLTGAGNAITVVNPSQFFVTTAITGGGSLTKNGSGVLFLNAAESYSGNTVVSSGTLALYSGGFDGSVNNSPGVSVSSAATVDVSGRSDGTFTVATGQTLSGGVGTNGPGTINGSLIVSTLGALAVGSGTNAGTLSVSSNATLSGSAVMKISAAFGNDQLTAYGLAYGGTLVVTNVGGTFTNGQTFKLFNATNGVYNAGTFTSVTLPAASGLTWTNNLTSNGTITAGVAAGPTGPGSITYHTSGNTLSLSWPAGQGWRLLAQTNSLSTGITSGGWSYVTDGTVSSTNITIDPTRPTVFYRLTYP